MTTVAVYTRVSHDPDGVSGSPSRQAAACRAYAKSRRWKVLEVYEDVDLSAFDPKVHRPALEALRLALPDVDGVLVWRLDRLFRRPIDFEHFWLDCEAAGTFLASATEPVDTTNEVGLVVVRLLITFAQMECVAKSERLKLSARERLERGEFGRHSAFGHTEGYRGIVEREAALLREAAARCLAGEPLDHICADFNLRGARSRRGNFFHESSLRTMLLQPRLVGDHHIDGKLFAAGRFPAILDRATGDALQERLVRKGLQHKRKPPTPALLGGWLLCGVCGSRMNAGGDRYSCPQPPFGCGRCGISRRAADAWIEHEVIWRSQLTATLDPITDELAPVPVTMNRWARWGTGRRRAAIAEALHHAIVKPGTRGGRHRQTERLDPAWLVDIDGVPPFGWVSRPQVCAATVDGRYMRTTTASVEFGLSQGRIAQIAASRVVPAKKINGMWLIDRAALAAYLAKPRQHRRRVLDGREDQVMRLHDQGHTAAVIAGRLAVSVASVHRALRAGGAGLPPRTGGITGRERDVLVDYVAGASINTLKHKYRAGYESIAKVLHDGDIDTAASRAKGWETLGRRPATYHQ